MRAGVPEWSRGRPGVDWTESLWAKALVGSNPTPGVPRHTRISEGVTDRAGPSGS